MFVARRLRTLLIVIATIANCGLASAQTNAGQKAASPAQAPQKTAAGKSSAAVPMFVPMRKDIQCELHGVSYRSVVGANQLNNTSGSVDGVTCWVAGKSPEQKKDIPLVSSTITAGMLQTKDFGNLKLAPTNNINSTATGMAIRSDKVQPLRTFLAQVSTPTGSDAYVPIKANCIVYHSGYKGTIVAPGVSEPTGTVAKLECNGKNVEIANNNMVGGIIVTKTYGKVKVHFGSMVATVGAGDFTSVAEGKTAPERVRDISVDSRQAESFKDQFQQQDKPAAK
jgi:hypothetical protein